MAEQQRKLAKKLPKRTGKASKKITRAASRARSESIKAARRNAQAAAHRRNVAEGISPWQRAKAARAARRQRLA
jgi:hypothetical protein